MLQTIADKMKRHILVTSSIETQGDEDEDDKPTLIQIQDDAKLRAETRLVTYKFSSHFFHQYFILKNKASYTFKYCIIMPFIMSLEHYNLNMD